MAWHVRPVERPVGLEFASIREVAVVKAADPLSLEALHYSVEEVGALTLEGRRVEAALYHRGSVVGVDGALTLPRTPDGGHVSPVTGEPVDGFQIAPPLADLERFVEFADWDEDGMLTVIEVALALAAVLPIHAEGAERFLRDRFDVGHHADSRLSAKLVKSTIVPACLRSGRGSEAAILRAAVATKPPVLWRGSSIEDLYRWFDHWDVQRAGDLEVDVLRFAISRALFAALAAEPDVQTAKDQADSNESPRANSKEDPAHHSGSRKSVGSVVLDEVWEVTLDIKMLVSTAFLKQVRLEDYASSRRSRVKREEFCLHMAPSLLANLSDRPPPAQVVAVVDASDVRGSSDAAVVYAAAVCDNSWLPPPSPAPAFTTPARAQRTAETVNAEAPKASSSAAPLANEASQTPAKESPTGQPPCNDGAVVIRSIGRVTIDRGLVQDLASCEASWLPPVSPEPSHVSPSPQFPAAPASEQVTNTKAFSTFRKAVQGLRTADPSRQPLQESSAGLASQSGFSHSEKKAIQDSPVSPPANPAVAWTSFG